MSTQHGERRWLVDNTVMGGDNRAWELQAMSRPAAASRRSKEEHGMTDVDTDWRERMRGNRYRCVVDGCSWALDHVSSGLPDGPVQVAPGSTLLETVARAQSRVVDQALRAHLESHDVVEFVATISRLRAAAES